MIVLDSPLREIVAASLMIAGALCAVRGTRRLARGLGDAVSLDVIRGVRGWVIAFAMAAFTAGVLAAESGFLVLGAVFLGEELYETGIVVLIIRGADARPERR